MRLAALCVLYLLVVTPARADVENALSAFVDDDYAMARQQAEPLAGAGEASAQFLLRLIYDRRYDIEPDEIQVAYWYSQGADQGLKRAAEALAEIYASGRGITSAGTKLVELYEAASRDKRHAALGLAGAYLLGDRTAVNKPAADRWYARAAERSLLPARVQLGWMLFDGDRIETDKATGVNLLRQAAAQGDAAAVYRVGPAYDIGDGVDRDNAETAVRYRKAAGAGSIEAQYRLGLFYANGEGVEQDRAEGLFWLTIAAAQAHRDATDTAKRLTRKLPDPRVAEVLAITEDWLNSQAPADAAVAAVPE